jgi:hypothetical protein
MIVIIGKRIRRDVHLVNKHFAFFNPGIRIFQVNAAKSKGFNFGSQKDHSGFVSIFDKIAVSGFSVFSYNFYVVCAQILFSPNPDKPALLPSGVRRTGRNQKYLPQRIYVTVHGFRVQSSGLRTKKVLKIRSPRYKCSFPQVIANLALNFGLGLKKLTLFS